MNVLIAYFSGFIVILPIAISLLRRTFSIKHLLPIFLLMLFSLIIETLNFICSIQGRNSMFLLDFYTPVEFILFALFYKHFFDSIRRSYIHYFLIFLFLGVAVFDTFFINDFLTVNNFSDSIESIVFIIYSLLAFFFIMKNLMYPDLLNTSFFWINIAILIYFAGNLFLFLFSNHLQKNDQAQYSAIYKIHSVTNILYYILITIGFWKAARK